MVLKHAPAHTGTLLATSLVVACLTTWSVSISAETGDSTPETSTEDSESTTAPRHRPGRDGYRQDMDRMIKERKKRAEGMRQQREAWQSQRRWWRNPGAEDRRQWNKARTRWHHDMMDKRRESSRNSRPHYEYGRAFESRYGRGYESWRYYP